MLFQPQSCPLPLLVISSAILSLVPWSLSRPNILSVPPSCAQAGSRLLRKVLPAMQGYWSAVTSTPPLLASSILSMAPTTFPQFSSPLALKWLMWTGMPDLLPISVTSSMDSSSFSPSFLIWTTKTPPYAAAILQSSVNSSASAQTQGG